MFAEWVTMGAQIGITAFFAVLIFVLICLAVMGIFTVILQLFRAEDDE